MNHVRSPQMVAWRQYVASSWLALPLLYCPQSILKKPHLIKIQLSTFIFIWLHGLPCLPATTGWRRAVSLGWGKCSASSQSLHQALLPSPAESQLPLSLCFHCWCSYSRVKKKMNTWTFISTQCGKSKDTSCRMFWEKLERGHLSVRMKNIPTCLVCKVCSWWKNRTCHYETTGQFSHLRLPVYSRRLNLWGMVYVILMEMPPTGRYSGSEKANSRILWVTHILTRLN